MSNVKVRIYQGTDFLKRELTRTEYLESGSNRKLRAKKAGQLLANNFPEFDVLTTRNGLQKTVHGFLAMRSLEPTEKCDYHYIWE